MALDVTSIPLARLWTKLDSTLMQLKHQLAAPPAARMVINSNTPPNRVMMVNTKKAPRDVRFIGRMAASMPHEVTSEHTLATAASHTPSMPHIDPPHQPPVTTATCARDRQMVAAATDQYSVEGTSNVVPTMLEFEGSGNSSEVDVEVTEDASQVDVEVTDDSPQVTAEGNDGSQPAEVDDTEEHGNSHPGTGTNTRSQAKIPKKVAPPTRRKSACARRRAVDTQGFQSLPRGGATSRVRGRVEDLRGDAGVSCGQTDVVGTNESEPATSATALAAGSRDGDDNDTRSPVAPAAVSRRKRGANVKHSPKKRKRSAVRKKVNDGETTPDKLTAEEQKELLDAVETVLPQLLGSMMNNRELHEKIAENINKVSGRQSSGSLPPTPHSVPPVDLDLFENQQHQVPDEWVRGAMEMTEHDPLFEGLFNILDLDDYGLETSHKPPANSTMPHVTATASTIPARNHELGAALKGNQLDSSSRPPGSACVAGSAADVSQRGTDETVESINQVNLSCSSLRVEGATSRPDLPNVAPCSPGNRPHGVTPGGDSVAVLTGAVPATTPQTELPRSTELRCTDPVDSSSFAPLMAAPLRPATPPAAVRLAKPPRSPSCAVAMLSDSRGAPSASPRPAHTCATTSKSMDATSAVPVVVAMAPASSAHPATTASHTRSPCHDSSSAEGVPWHSPLTSEHSKERGKGSPDVSNLVVDTSPRRQPRRSQTMSELSMLDVICGLVPDPVNSDPVNSDLITSDIQALSTKLMTSSDLSASNRGRQEMTEATSSLVEATDSSMPAVGSGSVAPYKGAMSAANDQCRETSEEPHDSSSVASVTMATLSGPGITMPSSSVAAITTLTSSIAGVTVPISNVAGKTMPTSSVPDTVVPMSSVASVTVPKSSVAGVIMPTSSVVLAPANCPKSSVVV
ncbi:PREDICTED: mucin-19-like [Priapulus caudatus]|uniref:Mucin-19-like n=1 Tax=Priapulus caudatus TaxID=37621 RepID=A0ABM1E3F8_PRICU|nr:PREDICTED: mucin-19-like [Priapulus caudatus]